jgi:hypothetical protein
MSGGIFLLQGEGKLVEMTEQPYDTEAVLQKLLADYPNLLAGDQMDAAAPRRWLLVSREMGVPSEDEGGDRWSLDHLFLDQDAIPTLIEVKRSSDTRIRREVVGQMLDYAANAVTYWPVEAIRARFEESCRLRGLDPAKEVETLAGPGGGVEEFWQRVKTNLQAERVRMVFVADVIPPELRRVVEFLNGQMDPAEVLAVEIKQFVGEGLKTLVPRVIGQTVEAERKKGQTSPRPRKTDEATFLAEMTRARGTEECDAAKRVVEWARDQRLDPNFNVNQQSTSFIPIVETGAGQRYPVSVNTSGNLWVQMKWLRGSAPFRDEAKRKELWERLNAIPGVSVPVERMTGFPTIPLQTLTNDASLRAFLDTLAWMVQELRQAPT